MKKLIMALLPTVAAAAWRNRDDIKRWIDQRRGAAEAPVTPVPPRPAGSPTAAS